MVRCPLNLPQVLVEGELEAGILIARQWVLGCGELVPGGRTTGRDIVTGVECRLIALPELKEVCLVTEYVSSDFVPNPSWCLLVHLHVHDLGPSLN